MYKTLKYSIGSRKETRRFIIDFLTIYGLVYED